MDDLVKKQVCNNGVLEERDNSFSLLLQYHHMYTCGQFTSNLCNCGCFNYLLLTKHYYINYLSFIVIKNFNQNIKHIISDGTAL